jgi:GT2 family glycosyltransferase
MTISTLVGLRNNLEYSQKFYKRFREIYPTEELVFVSWGSSDGTHEWLDSLNDENLIKFYSEESKTFSDTFNKCAELATKEYIVFCHNDIVVCSGFLENLQKHCADKRVVSYTTIEPPVFAGHARPGKIIMDFGGDFDTLKLEELEQYAEREVKNEANKKSDGISFFMCQSRKRYLQMGGMDNLFNPMFSEDDDLIRRLGLLGFEQYTALDSVVYHFVSKTSRFSPEHERDTKVKEVRSNNNFLRKWGTYPKNTIQLVFDVGLVIKNASTEALNVLESLVTTLYVDCDPTEYINMTQPYTKFNLSKKIKSINDGRDNDIIISLDFQQLTDKGYEALLHLTSVISQAKNVGMYNIEGINIQIVAFNTYHHKLITLKSEWYTRKCI